MTSARAVYVKLARGGIVNNLQKLVYLGRAGVFFIDDGNVNVAHAGSFDGWLFLLPGVVGQINDRMNSNCCQAS